MSNYFLKSKFFQNGAGIGFKFEQTRSTMKRKALLVGFMIAAELTYYSCEHQPFVLPQNQRTGDPNICFERDVLPIFQSNCAKGGCHDATSHKSGYILDSYDNIIKKGVVPGNPAASTIWQSVAYLAGTTPMPEGASQLPANQLFLIRQWIATGAIDSGIACATSSCDTNVYTYSGAVQPIMQTYCVGCHNSPSVPGGSLNDYNSVKEAAVNGRLIGDIKHLPGYNPMPQGGAKLADCQITQIEKWVASGAPNN